LPTVVDENIVGRPDGQAQELTFFELVEQEFRRLLPARFFKTLFRKTPRQLFGDATNFILPR
jgi:hypothetical protein